MAHDVFVSHSSKDKPTADAVCAMLEAQGIRCWVAPRDIIPGRDWGASIIDAINGTRVMLLLLSADANASPQIQREVERAVHKGIPIIPVRMADIEPTGTLEYFLSSPHWLDAFPPPLERHLDRLTQVVRQSIPRPLTDVLPSPAAKHKLEAQPMAHQEAESKPEAPRRSGAPTQVSTANKRKIRRGALALAAVLIIALAFVGGYFGPDLSKSQSPEKTELTSKVGLQPMVPPQKFPQASQGWTNSLGMKFVPVPGTDVLFGVWDVRVKDFRVFARDVAGNGRWNYHRGQNPFILKSDGWKQRGWDYGWQNPGFAQTDEHPVTCVSWEDATNFCHWLTEEERSAGTLAANQSYRLPTDNEWSTAIGPQKFPRGGTMSPPDGAGNYAGSEAADADWPANIAIMKEHHDAFARTSPVGSFAANAFGLYDMSGNVWQWCEDWYRKDMSSQEAPGEDGVEKKYRVSRGGSWYSVDPVNLSSGPRRRGVPGDRSGSLGFRCVLVVGGVAPVAEEKLKFVVPEAPATANAKRPAVPPSGQRWTNSLGQIFVPVPGTSVLFCIWDTRVRDYRAYAQARGGVERSWENPEYKGQKVTPTEDCPVVNVSWHSATNFCRWLTDKERAQGWLGPSQEYRLPQDWEWSVAAGLHEARGGKPKDKHLQTPGVYPWGTNWPPKGRVGNYADATAYRAFSEPRVIEGYDDGYATTSPVGSFEANRFGLFDMGGDVWQWCEDWYDMDRKSRVLRGASWYYYNPDHLLSSYRLHNSPDHRYNHVGFRVVLASGSSR